MREAAGMRKGVGERKDCEGTMKDGVRVERDRIGRQWEKGKNEERWG